MESKRKSTKPKKARDRSYREGPKRRFGEKVPREKRHKRFREGPDGKPVSALALERAWVERILSRGEQTAGKG